MSALSETIPTLIFNQLRESGVEFITEAEAVARVREELAARGIDVNGTDVEGVVSAAYMLAMRPILTTFAEPRNFDALRDNIINIVHPYEEYSHAAAAEIFARLHIDDVRYLEETDKFYRWNGKYWAPDNAAVNDAMDHMLAGYRQVALLDERLAARRGAVCKELNSNAFRNGTFSTLKNKTEVRTSVSVLDADDWLLNTPLGIVDLRSSGLIPHDRKYMMTRTTQVAPDLTYSEEKFAASRFYAFLQEIFEPIGEGRKELIGFLQAMMGYCLTGDTSIHVLSFWHGEGRNGKSTLGELVEWIMGEYAKKVTNTLLMSANSERHPTEIANLMGARMVVSSEITEGSYWDENRIKELTGDSIISARFMRQDFFEFRRTHKHIVYGNHKPRLRVVDAAIKDRLKLIEFGVNFAARGTADPELGKKLRAEAPLVLSWMIDGARKVYEAGVRLPQSEVVIKQTDDYMTESDTIGIWISERCYEQKAGETKPIETAGGVLFRDYTAWKKARGEHAESVTRWAQQLMKRFHKRMKDGRAVYVGIGLRDDRESLAEF